MRTEGTVLIQYNLSYFVMRQPNSQWTYQRCISNITFRANEQFWECCLSNHCWDGWDLTSGVVNDSAYGTNVSMKGCQLCPLMYCYLSFEILYHEILNLWTEIRMTINARFTLSEPLHLKRSVGGPQRRFNSKQRSVQCRNRIAEEWRFLRVHLARFCMLWHLN